MRSWRAILVRWIGALLIVCGAPSMAGADCTPGPCTFTSSYRLDGGSSVSFKLELGQNFNNWFANGIAQVANAVSQYGVSITSSTTSGNLSVYVDPALLSQPDVWARTDGTTYVKVSPSALSYSNTIVARLLSRLGAHETLHIVVGAGHTGCHPSNAVMAYLAPSDVSANTFASTLTSDDSCGVTAAYEPVSPLILDTAEDGLSLTGPSVVFDIRGRGEAWLVGWTQVASDDVFLALDRNANGRIDSGRELFGNWTPMSNNMEGHVLAGDGFTALSFFDEPANGGDGDGYITLKDAIFPRLRLWRDADADGITKPEELSRLLSAGIIALKLQADQITEVDAEGNVAVLHSECLAVRRGRLKWISIYDVLLTSRE